MNVGAAQIDITPDFSTDLSGYGLRQQPATGVLAPIFARAVYIGGGGDERGGDGAEETDTDERRTSNSGRPASNEEAGGSGAVRGTVRGGGRTARLLWVSCDVLAFERE